MNEKLFVVPSPRDPYVELARTASGRLFRKQILKDGQSFVHPADKKSRIEVTPDLQQKLVENFHKGYADIVQFPVTGVDNRHTESVLSNLGEVIDVEYEPGKGTYAIIDARKHADDVNRTILGASAFFSLDYEDTSSGKRVGPTLLHVAATNRPYLTNLEPYEEIVAASNVSASDVVVLSDLGLLSDQDRGVIPGGADTSGDVPDYTEEHMELDELLAELKDKHGIDVAALQESADELESAREQLGDVQLSATDGSVITSVDLAEAVIELSNTVKEQGGVVSNLRAENDRLTRERAESEIDGLIQTGRVLPKQRDDMIKLSMTDREMFDRLVPDTAIVSLSEDGVTVYEEPEKAKEHEAVVERYVALAAPTVGRSRSKRRGE